MENRYTVSIVHGEHATLYHVVDAGAPEGEQPDIVLSLHNKPHAQAMAEELNKQAARIRELEGALRALLSITRPGPHDRNAKDEPHVELCRRWNDARRVLGGAS